MAKLTLQQTLDKSLKTAKQYIDTELAKKANTHDHNYLPTAGGTATGNIILYNSTNGDSPALIFQRGTTSDTYTDWRLQDRGGSLYFDKRVSDGSFSNAINFNENGAISATGGFNGNATSASKLTTARTLTIGNTGKTFDGSANVSWSLSEIGAATSGHTHTTLDEENLAGKTLSLDDLKFSDGKTFIKYYYCNTDGGGSNITGRPNDNEKYSFNLKVELTRWSTSSDYIFKQTYTVGHLKQTYIRYCNSGTWSAWEKVYTSVQKPTLTELGAAATSHGHSNMVQGSNTSRTTNQDGNANDIAASGFYRVNSTNSTSNPLPDGAHAHILHGQHPSGAYAYQIGVPYNVTNKIYFRNNPSSSWGGWNRIYHTGDKPTASEVGAIATTGGNVTGNLTLYNSSSGDTPGLVFQRGTTSDSYYDWKIHDSGGVLYFGVKTNSNSDFDKKISMSENGVITATTFSGTATNSNKVGGYSVWVGTQAEYNAISSKSSTTIYYIKG